jgi:phosphoglycerate kinase
MIEDIATLDDFNFAGKTVFVRCDLNTPIDPKTGEFLEDRRIKSHKETLLELAKKKAKVVALAHQGRAGDAEFTTLEKHAKHLSEVLGVKVKYVDDIFGTYARESVKKMKDGEIVLLENTRFYAEEEMERPPDVQANTFLVKKLAPLCEIFINDAFGTAHRSQPSTVGFTQLVPSGAGRLMESEIVGLSKCIKNPKKPLIFVLGGAKVTDSLKIIEKALGSDVEKILTGGLLANIFLIAKGYRVGEPTIEVIRGKKLTEQIPIAQALLEKNGEKIILPSDVALDKSGERFEIPLGDLPQDYPIKDVGKNTVKTYVDMIKNSGTVFYNGALGVYEEKKFAYGTEETIRALTNCRGISVIGGGDTVAAARNLGVEDKISHVSTGGKASIKFISGSKLAAIEALRGKGRKVV